MNCPLCEAGLKTTKVYYQSVWNEDENQYNQLELREGSSILAALKQYPESRLVLKKGILYFKVKNEYIKVLPT